MPKPRRPRAKDTETQEEIAFRMLYDARYKGVSTQEFKDAGVNSPGSIIQGMRTWMTIASVFMNGPRKDGYYVLAKYILAPESETEEDS